MLIAPETLDFSLPDARTIPTPPRADEALRRSIQARGILQTIRRTGSSAETCAAARGKGPLTWPIPTKRQA